MNPAPSYLDEKGNPVVCLSFCAFVDILGFSRCVLECTTLEESQALCERVRTTLNDRRFELNGYTSEATAWYDGEYQMFSDSLVLGHLFHDVRLVGEPELGEVLGKMGRYQLILALDGFFVRGGLSIGELHLSKDQCFGKALVEAAHMESHMAKVPRIVASDGVMRLVRHHLTFYGRPEGAPHAYNLLVDTHDNHVFINYLCESNYGEHGSDLVMLRKHRDNIQECLDRFASDVRILDKYQWVCDYHNYFCRTQVVGSDDWCPTTSQVADLMIERTGTASREFRRLGSEDADEMRP